MKQWCLYTKRNPETILSLSLIYLLSNNFHVCILTYSFPLPGIWFARIFCVPENVCCLWKCTSKVIQGSSDLNINRIQTFELNIKPFHLVDETLCQKLQFKWTKTNFLRIKKSGGLVNTYFYERRYWNRTPASIGLKIP